MSGLTFIFLIVKFYGNKNEIYEILFIIMNEEENKSNPANINTELAKEKVTPHPSGL